MSMGLSLEVVQLRCSTSTEDEDSLRVTRRLDEVDASVNSVVDELEPVDPVLLLEVGIKAGIDVVDDGLPAMMVRFDLLGN